MRDRAGPRPVPDPQLYWELSLCPVQNGDGQFLTFGEKKLLMCDLIILGFCVCRWQSVPACRATEEIAVRSMVRPFI